MVRGWAQRERAEGRVLVIDPALQDKLAEELAASSRMVSNMHARVGDPGAMVARGRVAEK
jgi:hypothetical protein